MMFGVIAKVNIIAIYYPIYIFINEDIVTNVLVFDSSIFRDFRFPLSKILDIKKYLTSNS